MSRAAYKTETMFVACPYSKSFGYEKFRSYMTSHYPGTVIFAETHLQTRHLLGILKGHIKKTDFCLFDVSTWNPNVSLELGLAEGMKVKYYITLNSSLSTNVPSDIQGIQRIEYSVLEKGALSLGQQFQRYIVKEKTFVGRKLWQEFKEEDKADRLFTLAIRVICHFRDKKTLKEEKIKALASGLRLRSPDRDRVIEVLRREKFIKHSGNKYALNRNVFKPYKVS